MVCEVCSAQPYVCCFPSAGQSNATWQSLKQILSSTNFVVFVDEKISLHLLIDFMGKRVFWCYNVLSHHITIMCSSHILLPEILNQCGYYSREFVVVSDCTILCGYYILKIAFGMARRTVFYCYFQVKKITSCIQGVHALAGYDQSPSS